MTVRRGLATKVEEAADGESRRGPPAALPRAVPPVPERSVADDHRESRGCCMGLAARLRRVP